MDKLSYGFNFGFGLFSFNIALILLLSRRLLLAPNEEGKSTRRRIDVLTGVSLAFIKVFSSGVGLYVGTRVLGCSVAWIITGAFAALLVFTGGVAWVEVGGMRSSAK